MTSLSFWEQQSFTEYDYTIVGAGLVGLSTAISLAEDHRGANIIVLERGIFPTGASTKNAGFACFGSLSELYQDLELLGSEAMLSLVEERWLGLQKLRQRLGDQEIGYMDNGGYELIREHEFSQIEHINTINGLLEPLFKQKIFSEVPELIKKFGFDHKSVQTMVFNPLEGQIDTGLMMKNLLHEAQKLGVKVLTGAEVRSFYEDSQHVSLEVVGGLSKEVIGLRTAQLGICTNAFTNSLVPKLDLKPGRGLVLVTKPLNKLKFRGVFHYDSGYFYFRDFGDRVIFGGGRNLDFERETTRDLGINPILLDHLVRDLKELILPGQPFEVERTWSGIMAFGKSKQPILKKHSERVALAVRLGGMGIAMGSRLGERLAKMMC